MLRHWEETGQEDTGCERNLEKLTDPNQTKAEGQVFGIGCKIFTIAGPVVLYGIFSSWVWGGDLLDWKVFWHILEKIRNRY